MGSARRGQTRAQYILYIFSLLRHFSARFSAFPFVSQYFPTAFVDDNFWCRVKLTLQRVTRRMVANEYNTSIHPSNYSIFFGGMCRGKWTLLGFHGDKEDHSYNNFAHRIAGNFQGKSSWAREIDAACNINFRISVHAEWEVYAVRVFGVNDLILSKLVSPSFRFAAFACSFVGFNKNICLRGEIILIFCCSKQ